MNKTVNVKNITLISMGIALNVVGAFIALNLRLPIYLDSIGTILIACMLGPKYAVITGVGGSLVSGMTFDIYSLYFAPVQITTGYLAGLSATIAAFLFGGVTSSGSSYIVQILSHFNVPIVVGVFVTQVFTDYADKFLAVVLVGIVVNSMPKALKTSMTTNK